MFFARFGHQVGVGEYGHYTAQAQESTFNSGETNKAFFILGKLRSCSEYAAMVTS